jgi:hypothetical protein
MTLITLVGPELGGEQSNHMEPSTYPRPRKLLKNHVTLQVNPDHNVTPLYGHTAAINGAVASPNK